MKQDCPVNHSIVRGICTRVSNILNGGGDYGGTLYTELLNTDYIFCEEEVWDIIDSIKIPKGTPKKETARHPLLHAIICSQVLDSVAIFRLLRSTSFDDDMSWLAFQYYADKKLQVKTIVAREKRFLPTHFLRETSVVSQSDISSHELAIEQARERRFDELLPSQSYAMA